MLNLTLMLNAANALVMVEAIASYPQVESLSTTLVLAVHHLILLISAQNLLVKNRLTTVLIKVKSKMNLYKNGPVNKDLTNAQTQKMS